MPDSDNSSTIESSSELFLNDTDLLVHSLTIEKLNGENYGHWVRSATFFLIAKNKLGFVDGTCKKPAQGDANCSRWDRCDKMVISWLLHSLDPSIQRSVLFCQSSAEIWNELKR